MRAVGALRTTAEKSQDDAVRAACRRALARLGAVPETAEAMLMSDNVEGRRDAAEAFGLAGDTTKTERILALKLEQRDAEIARVYDLALGRLSRRATLEEMGALARSASPYERQRAVAFFGELGSPRMLGAIAPLFNDEREELRAGACRAAASMRAAGAQPAVRRLLHDAAASVREAAAVAAYRIGDELVVDELARKIGDPSPAVRDEICRTLGAMGTPLAVPALATRLDDTARCGPARKREGDAAGGKSEAYPTVRDAAVRALEAITGFDCGYDSFALDDAQGIAVDKLKAYLAKNATAIADAELL
jgi:HEAT repeat protein